MRILRIVLVVLGSLFLMGGIFSPVVKLPFIGEATYMDQKQYGAYVIILLTVLSLVFLFIKKHKWLWLTASSIFLVLIFNYYDYHQSKNDINKSIKEIFPFVELADVTDILTDAIQLKWGVFVLLTGAILIATGATLRNKNS